MGSGLHTTDDDMMREHQQRDMRSHAQGTQGQNAIGLQRGPTIDELPEIEDGPKERLVQPGTNTPARGLGNIVNGHNRPADHAPQSAIAVPNGDRAPS